MGVNREGSERRREGNYRPQGCGDEIISILTHLRGHPGKCSN